ncbi:unnamed protein product, partial [Rotaria magnacalcarata]
SEWTFDMDPLTIHVERSPLCTFVQNWLPLNKYKQSTPLQSPPKLDLFIRTSIQTTKDRSQTYLV